MYPSKIKEVLDLARHARSRGMNFIPLFRGPAGLGKSEIAQQWQRDQQVKEPDFGFIDLRLAYYESPDVVGYPFNVKDSNGLDRTQHALPGFWPTEGSGIILLEEINRASQAVMNTMMQLLTDRQVGPHYKLPEGWIIAGCINPDDATYDVNSMDTALMDRFVTFDIEFDHHGFVTYAERSGWHENIISFLKSASWTYKSADSLAKGAKYISPRTWYRLNAAEKSGASRDRMFHSLICHNTLGKEIGQAYWASCWDDTPVSAADLLRDKESAFKKLKEQSNPENYKGDKIAVTIDSIIQNYGGPKDKCVEGQIDEDLMAEVAMIIPTDQVANLIKKCGVKAHGGITATFFKDFIVRHPDLSKIIKSNIRINRQG